MKTNHEIALELAHRTCTKYLHVPDSSSIQYSFSARHLVDFVEKLVAAVDAERGKDAVAKIVTYLPTRGRKGVINVTAYCPIDSELPAHKKVVSTQPLFLSPTIPEGECGCKLVPDYDAIRDAERYRFLRDEENWVDDDPDFAIRPWETLGESSGKEFDSTIDSYMEHRKDMIQAAGVTK